MDDYLFSQAEAVLPATGAMICLFLQVLGVPLSWKKLQVSSRVHWIGWCFCYTSGVVSLAEEKRLKLLGMVQDLQRNPKISRKDLERFVGLALWAAHLFPTMKSLLYTFYHDLFSPAATNYSVAPDVWPQLRHHLTDSLQFKSALQVQQFRSTAHFCQSVIRIYQYCQTWIECALQTGEFGCVCQVNPVQSAN